MVIQPLDRRLLYGLFLLALLFWLNIGFGLLQPATGSFILKWVPSAILALIVYRHRTSWRSFLLFCAILIQSIGAVILDFDRSGYVLYSLAFTGCAHLCYSARFLPALETLKRIHFLRWIFLGGLWIYALFYGSFVADHLPARMQGPVIFYMILLTLAGTLSLLSGLSWLVVLGMFFFILDDSVFSYHLFVSPIPANHFITWPTYIAGQTCIVLGCIRR